MKIYFYILAVLSFMIAVMLMTGCAGIPSQFANVTPPLSQTDTNIVKACATIQANLVGVEVAVSTATPLILNQTIKQQSTLVRVGGFINLAATQLKSINDGTALNDTVIQAEAAHLNTTVNLSPSELAIANQITLYAQKQWASMKAQLDAYANSATDPQVKAYVEQTSILAFGAILNGVTDGTNQYSGTSLTFYQTHPLGLILVTK